MERPDTKRWNEVARMFLGDDFFTGFQNAATNAGVAGGAAVSQKKGVPLADVYHDNEEVIVLIELPGVENIQGLDMQIQGENLTIKGDFATGYTGYELKSSERLTGKFEKNIVLGANVSNRYTSAKYRKGVLELRFPMVRADAPQKIKLKKNL